MDARQDDYRAIRQKSRAWHAGSCRWSSAERQARNACSQRHARGEVLDDRLWTEVAAATGARGNTTALVGTPEQVAESMLEYYDLGVTTFLIRGFDPLEDAIDYGRKLIPIVRREIARREARGRVAEQAAG